MQDRLLCRAKRIDTGEWVKGYYVNSSFWGEHVLYVGSSAYLYPFEIISNTLCQSTGLRDKNGKLIFENDIVKNKIAMGIVKFGNPVFFKGSMCSFFYWQMTKQIDYLHFCFDDDVFAEFKDLEIIGNAIDNPEMMEG